jgi:hypothetical protein
MALTAAGMALALGGCIVAAPARPYREAPRDYRPPPPPPPVYRPIVP